MLSYQRFCRLAQEAWAQVPAPLTAALPGGLTILRRAKADPELPDVFLLGEYVEDPWLGSRIVLYYGSFLEVFRDAPDQEVEEELKATIRHELRHHVEAQAGVHDLDQADLQEREAWLAEQRQPPSPPGRGEEPSAAKGAAVGRRGWWPLRWSQGR